MKSITLHRERAQLAASFERVLARVRAATDEARARSWPTVPGLAAWQRTATARLKELLGWPIVGGTQARVKPRWMKLHADARREVHLVSFGVTGAYATFALLFLPRSRTKATAPLVVAQHGGLGLVEKISGLGYPTTNYHNFVDRLCERGCAVLVPQLPMWNDRAKPTFDQDLEEPRLRLLGGSFPALNVLTIQRALDAALARPELRRARVGLAGLSYGGCIGLYAAALDPRIRALVSSCFFNARHTYPMTPSVPPGAAKSLLDAELGALICPRALWIEVATRDELFTTTGAKQEAAKIRRLYRSTHHAARFRYVEFDGTHEFNRGNDGLDFLVRALAD